MRIAFKEWSVVDEALGAGEQTILLRKGGIHERHGRFEVEHDEFLVYPTYLHQKPDLVKPDFRGRCRDSRSDRTKVTIRHFVRVAGVFQAPASGGSAGSWDALHIYSPALIEKRYQYRPERPLYILLVRAYRLAAATTIHETPQYAGCRSWVELNEDIDTIGAVPVLDDAAFATHAARVRGIFVGDT